MKKQKRKDSTRQPEATSTIARVASGIGIGLVAGLAGTVAMTAAQMIEMQITGREPSDMPYKAVKKTFGLEANSEEDKELISTVTHFAYGSNWGIPRGLMAAFGTDGLVGTATHFGAVWGAEHAVFPTMGIMEPVTEWEPKAIAVNALFHAIYAIAVGLTADALIDRSKGLSSNP